MTIELPLQIGIGGVQTITSYAVRRLEPSTPKTARKRPNHPNPCIKTLIKYKLCFVINRFSKKKLDNNKSSRLKLYFNTSFLF